MVDAEQDVLDAEAEIRARPLPRRRVGAERDGWAHRLQQVALEPAVGVMDADEDVGDCRLEPVDGQRLARDAALAAERAADDDGARGELLLARRGQAALRRDHRRDRDLDLAARRLLPQEAVDARPLSRSSRKPGRISWASAGVAAASAARRPASSVRLASARRPFGRRRDVAGPGVSGTPGGPGVSAALLDHHPVAGQQPRVHRVDLLPAPVGRELALDLRSHLGERRQAPPRAPGRGRCGARSPSGSDPAQRPGSILRISSANSSPKTRATSLRVARSHLVLEHDANRPAHRSRR